MSTQETEHLARLRQGLAECTVLLKKDGMFPLSAPGEIAVYGSGVRHTVKGGTGSGDVNSRYFVTVEQGLKEAGFSLTTEKWLDAYDEVLQRAHDEFVREIKRRAKEKHTQAIIEGIGAVMPEPEYDLPLDGKGDTAVYVLSRISGEGNDRQPCKGDFLLTETERRDILAANAQYETFLLVLNVGGPVDLSPVLEVKNILVLSQLGVETGSVLADLLLGKAYPSGKLASTWAGPDDYPDVGSFGDINETLYTEGIYVGYRWFDAAQKKPLFSFGCGLGYTEFSVRDSKVNTQGSVVTVTCTVQNTGDFAGKETIQVYVSAPWGTLDKPVKELAAFAKTKELAAGERTEVTVSFDLRDSASYDAASAAYLLEQGEYGICVGTSGEDAVRVCALRLDAAVYVKQVKNLFPKPEKEDWKPRESEADTDPSLPVIPLAAADFATKTVSYEGQDPVEEEMDSLTAEELCRLNMGAFDPKARGMQSFLGPAFFSVAGAAGETTDAFREKGVPKVVMADGPAGLRLSPEYYKDEKGVHSLAPPFSPDWLEFLPRIARGFLGRTPKLPKGAERKEQYCTAIPIGTAVAQSFNPDFAALCGDVVGSEMDEFGVSLWLAPALNIHRSPLCGRNFEYYSEDPVVSGVMAAAITRGVQQHNGKGVTLKHFAANNQETNRYFSNSVVSERALREIYLKGFAICIRESAPAAVMTSYNLINGTHTSESRALCTDFLRREFSFDGICMTDWVVRDFASAEGSVYSFPDPAVVAAAGGDLYMPGSKEDLERLQTGLREGRVTEEQLRINASRMCRVARKLHA